MKRFYFLVFLCNVDAFQHSLRSFFRRIRINSRHELSSSAGSTHIQGTFGPVIKTDLVVDCAMKMFQRKTFNISDALQQTILRDFTVILPRYLSWEDQELVRLYQFEHLGLQVLHQVDQFYSGTYKSTFWHQNSEQLMIYFPIHDTSLTKQDVNCTMDYRECSVSVRGNPVISFPLYDTIKPDASFWAFEEDFSGRRYIGLDLEKHEKEHNWKGLVSGLPEEELTILDRRSNLLFILYEQNKLVHNSNQTSVFNTNSISDDDEISTLKLPGKTLNEMLMDTAVVEAFVKQYINDSMLLNERDDVQDFLLERNQEIEAENARLLTRAKEQNYQPTNISMIMNAAGDATKDEKPEDLSEVEPPEISEEELEKQMGISPEDKEMSLRELLEALKKEVKAP
jgi:hypothetical protein